MTNTSTTSAPIHRDALSAANNGWTLSAHVRRDKGFDPYLLLAACHRPDFTYESHRHPGQFKFVRDGVAVVVDPRQKRVITAFQHYVRTALRPDQMR